MSKNGNLLQEIRDNFQHCVDAWADVRREARIDMHFAAGDPWNATEESRKDLDARRAAGRPVLSLDELGQYINQRINDLRQNKRAIKIDPRRYGATNKTAELRAGIIKDIEYNSKAQAAYITAYENALQRSYGFFAIGKRYVSDTSFDQELYLRRIPNPDTVYLDPDCKEADFSDMGYAFIIDTIPRKQFKARWPNAEIKDFSAEDERAYPQWIKADGVQVAEYWKVHITSRHLLLFENQETHYLDEWKGAELNGNTLTIPSVGAVQILKDRKCEEREVCQYIANGVEILEGNPQDVRWIPIIPVWGKELYVDDGAGSKRVFHSLIRNSRDAQMLHNFTNCNIQEIVGMTPKTKWLVAEGQTEGHTDEWATAHKDPRAFLTWVPVHDEQGNLLPKPERIDYEPPVQGPILVDEQAKRAIQNSMGMYNASVGRQDSEAKSGVAIKALDIQSDQGNFHFIDNFDRALEHAGRIMDNWIPEVYDTEREVGIRKPDDTYESVKINQPYADEKTGEPTENRTDLGEHEVTVSVGPSFQSQREEASAVGDSLIQNLEKIPADPGVKLKLLSLSIKNKNLGPLGDEMARILDPEQQEQADPAQMQMELQKYEQLAEALGQRVEALETERATKVLELENQRVIAEIKADVERLKIQKDAAVEEAKLMSMEGIEQLKLSLESMRIKIDALSPIGGNGDQPQIDNPPAI